MMNWKNKPLLITLSITLLGVVTGGLLFTNLVQLQQLSELIQNSGSLGYLVFVSVYVMATLMIFPTTAFNIAGGAIFGGVQGLIITSIAAITSAAIAFTISRSFGKKYTEQRLSKAWSELNAHLQVGGLPYALAVRFLPLVPYGIVSFVSGLSQIKKRDYFLGTLLGTPLGLAPFVWLGDSGVQAASGYSPLPLTASGGVLALLVIVGTWYQQNQTLKYKHRIELENQLLASSENLSIDRVEYPVNVKDLAVNQANFN